MSDLVRPVEEKSFIAASLAEYVNSPERRNPAKATFDAIVKLRSLIRPGGSCLSSGMLIDGEFAVSLSSRPSVSGSAFLFAASSLLFRMPASTLRTNSLSNEAVGRRRSMWKERK